MVLLHAMAAFGLAAALEGPWLAGGLSLLGISAWTSLRQSAAGLLRLVVRDDGSLTWTGGGGVGGEGMVLAVACAQPWLTSFCVGSGDGRRFWVSLFGDEASADELRRLRVRLRWAPDPGRAGPPAAPGT